MLGGATVRVWEPGWGAGMGASQRGQVSPCVQGWAESEVSVFLRRERGRVHRNGKGHRVVGTAGLIFRVFSC